MERFSAEEPKPSTRQAHPPLRRSFLWMLSIPVLLWVAIYNGYPAVTGDSGTYILAAIKHTQVSPYRAPGYPVFLFLVSFCLSPWLMLLAQAVITAVVLSFAFDFMGGANDWVIAVAIPVLSLATGLPWYVSQVMPDIFAPLMLLTFFLLLYDSSLSKPRRVFLAVIFCLSVSAHLSHVPVAIGLAALALTIRVSRITRSVWWHASWRQFLTGIVLPLTLAITGTCMLNYSSGLGFRLAPSRGAFLFSRLLQNGLAPRYLREHCATEKFITCRYVNSLPRDYMFEINPLRRDLGGLETPEVNTIVHNTIRAYPLAFVRACISESAQQLVTLDTGGEMQPHAQDFSGMLMLDIFPNDAVPYLESPQSSGKLKALSRRMSPYHVVFFWICLVGDIVFFVCSKEKTIRQFFLWVLVLLVTNAVVTASLATVVERYQSRVCWLVPLCFFFYIGSTVRGEMKGVAF